MFNRTRRLFGRLRAYADENYEGQLLEALRSLVVNFLRSQLKAGNILARSILIIFLVVVMVGVEILIILKKTLRHLWKFIRYVYRVIKRVVESVVGFFARQWGRARSAGSDLIGVIDELSKKLAERITCRAQILIHGHTDFMPTSTTPWGNLMVNLIKKSIVWSTLFAWALLLSLISLGFVAGIVGLVLVRIGVISW